MNSETGSSEHEGAGMLHSEISLLIRGESCAEGADQKRRRVHHWKSWAPAPWRITVASRAAVMHFLSPEKKSSSF